MVLVDTHTHIYLDQFATDFAQVIDRALSEGVTRFYMPGIDCSAIPDMLAIEEAYPGVCFAMMGLHPCYVKEDYKESLSVVGEWLEKRRFAAVGEVGLDFHWDTTYVKEQYDAFHIQTEWAKQYGLPLVIHSRKSTEESISLVREHQDGRLQGIFHCFSGTVDQARRIIELGFLLGIGGVVTYKNGGLEPVIREFGLEHVVLETDAPYLSPVPFRGERNEPSYLKYVAERLAGITGMRVEEVAEQTTKNADRVFGYRALE
jgi:TatD DNase family protein